MVIEYRRRIQSNIDDTDESDSNESAVVGGASGTSLIPLPIGPCPHRRLSNAGGIDGSDSRPSY